MFLTRFKLEDNLVSRKVETETSCHEFLFLGHSMEAHFHHIRGKNAQINHNYTYFKFR